MTVSGGAARRLHGRGPRWHGLCLLRQGRSSDTAEDEGFSFAPGVSLRVQQTIRDSPSIAAGLHRSRTPTMLVLGECSSQVRRWQTAVLMEDPAVDRVQYLTGVGHHLWNPLGNSTSRAVDVIVAYLRGEAAPLPDYPRVSDVPAFLRLGR